MNNRFYLLTSILVVFVLIAGLAGASTVSTPTPSSVTIVSGQTETFNTIIFNAIGPFTVNLVNTSTGNVVKSVSDPTVGSNTVPISFPGFSILTPNTYTYNVVVTDLGNSSQVFNSVTTTITVTAPAPQLTVSISESNAVIDQGQPELLTATSTMGTAPEVFTFYFADGATNGPISNCNGISTSSNTASCEFTQSFNGSQPYGVGVVSNSQTANSASILVNVVGLPPALTITPSSSTLPSGSTQETLTASVNGGHGPFSYTFYNITSGTPVAITGCSSILTNSCLFNVINQPGIYLFNATAVDTGTTAPYTFGSTKTTIEVNSLVAGQPTPATQTITAGQSAILTAPQPTGGAGSYTYQWYSSTSSAVPRPWNTSTAFGQGTLLETLNSSSWTAASGSTATVNTITYVEGGGSIELLIPKSTAFSNIEKAESTNVDLSHASNFYFWVYINNITDLSPPGTFGITLDLYSTLSSTPSYFQCGIQTGSLQDGWNPVVIASSACTAKGSTPNMGSISNVQFVVATNSLVNHNVAVNFGPLKYNYAGGAFNKAQVILTFDGSWSSTIVNATPIMRPNGQTGVAFIVTNEIGATGDGCGNCITSNQLETLYNDGWDISSHTVDHANLVLDTADGCPCKPLLTNTNNLYEMANSFKTLSNLMPGGFGKGPTVFAYPNGAYNSVVIGQIKSQNNYTIARALGFGITQPNLIPDASTYNLSYRVQSLVMAPGPTTAPSNVEADINQAISENGLLVFTFHIITGNPTTADCTAALTCYSTANFTILSNYLNQQQQAGKLQVTNFSAYYAAVNGTILNPVGSTSGPTLTVKPTVTTYYYYRVNSGPFVAYSPTAVVIVNSAPPTLTSNITASNSQIDVGQTVTLTASATGGTSPYSYNFIVLNSANTVVAKQTNPNTFTFTATNAMVGNIFANVAITDTSGITVSSNTIKIAVLNQPFISVAPTSQTVSVGNTVTTLVGTATDQATGAITYQWYDGIVTTANLITGATSNTYTPTSNTAGNFTYYLLATDTNHISFQSNPSSVTVIVPAAPTTTVPSGGGGGGSPGGSPGGGGGGSSTPIVSYVNSCAIVTQVTVPNSFDFTVNGQSFVVTDNYIGSNYTSVIVDGITYIINLNGTAQIGSGVNMRLTNVSYLPIEHTVSFSVCPPSSQPVSNSTTTVSTPVNVTVNANFNGNILTITSVTPANQIGNVTLSNVTSVPQLPAGYVGIFVSNLSITSNDVSSVNFNVNYNCSINSTALQPYMYKNGTWTQIKPFTVNTGACTVAFSVPKDPIIALLVHSVTPPAQIQPNNSTTTSAIVQNSTTIPQATAGKSSNTSAIVIAAVVIVAILIALGAAMTMRGGKGKGKTTKKLIKSRTSASGRQTANKDPQFTSFTASK